MASLVTSLMLTGRAKEAAEFYCALFDTSLQTTIPGADGDYALCTLSIHDQQVVIIGGSGPESHLRSQRVALQLHVDGQEEFDHYWYGLLEGGEARSNGWLIDRFGVWWSLVPIQQMRIFASATPEAVGRIGQALGQMDRIDIAELERIAQETDQA